MKDSYKNRHGNYLYKFTFDNLDNCWEEDKWKYFRRVEDKVEEHAREKLPDLSELLLRACPCCGDSQVNIFRECGGIFEECGADGQREAVYRLSACAGFRSGFIPTLPRPGCRPLDELILVTTTRG